MKQTWRTITETFNKPANNLEIPTNITYNIMTKLLQITKKLQICFNSYFANIVVLLSSSFEESDTVIALRTLRIWYSVCRIPSYETYLGDDNANPDLNFHFTEVSVLTLITNLQNKTRFRMDVISNKLLKRINHIIVQPLTLISNQSFTSSITYQDKFKISKILSLH